MCLFGSIVSINSHEYSLLEPWFLVVFNFINGIFLGVVVGVFCLFLFCVDFFFFYSREIFSVEFLCFPSLQKTDGLVYLQ